VKDSRSLKIKVPYNNKNPRARLRGFFYLMGGMKDESSTFLNLLKSYV
jgi:hypothetical protein